ncbi:TPA: regulator [Staphylococcus aureus]|jgi:hypothetical protein|uniref:hypothetical protein n=1 Tax=Staphylococcus TaxID=1279 RepID=UPI0005E96B61|nr:MULTISPECIES: hypothetical protein [Terrabacteria group]MDU1788465.1 regulator [Streptococcus thermophilus]MDU4468615.1 regulator [Streptococcus mitis]MDU4503533.1 regulator [Staphylococcus warneri]MDU4694038.1 hypothetical protein [Dermabacter sp.]MDU6089918.1 regulator [Staphylococcus lugdunensis]
MTLNYNQSKVNKTSLHLLVDPDIKKRIAQIANKGEFDNISQAGRYILKKGLEVVEKENI